MIKSTLIVIAAVAMLCFARATCCQELEEPDHRDLFYLAEGRLITLRVRVLIDGEDCHAFWRRHVEILFAEFDRDGDGALLSEEMDAARRFGQGPSSDRYVPPTSQAKAPTYEKATPEVLADIFRRLQAGPFVWQTADAVRRTPLPGFELSDQGPGDALFGKIDADGDGKISRLELLAAPAVLMKLDLNDDELIAAAELPSIPAGSSPYGPGRNRSSGSSPLVTSSTAIFEDGLPIRVLRRYNRGAESGEFRDSYLTPIELGLPDAAVHPFDADNDGRLNLDELKRFLADPPLTAEIVVRLGERIDRGPAVEMARVGDIHLAHCTDARVVLAGGTTVLEIRVDPAPPGFQQTVSRLFQVVDADANQYLDQAESGRFPLYRGMFDQIDRDADGKIYEKEILAFGERQAAFAHARVVAIVEDRGRKLFQTLDTNCDAQLDRRELLAATEVAAACDANGDECLEERELPTRTVMTFRQGQAMEPQLVAAFDRAAVLPASRSAPTAGPVWFQRMDRNADGEISRREFLGRIEKFEELDANRDGAVDVDEAALFR